MSFVSITFPDALPLSRRKDAAGPRADIAIHEGAAGLAQIEQAWRALAAGHHKGAFLGYGFALAMARYHEERGERVVVATVEWAGRVGCILPMAITRRSGAKVAVMLGDPVVQYCDALIAVGAPSYLAELAVQKLLERADADVYQFRRVRADAVVAPALNVRARPAGDAKVAPYGDLTVGATADETLLALGGAKQRKERQRSRRRLAEIGEVTFGVRRGAEAAEWLREAFAMKRVRLAQAGLASAVVNDPETVVAFERAAADPADGGDIVVTKLTVGDTPAAYEVGVVRGRRYHAYLGVTEDSFATQGPGKVAMEDTVRWCFDQGLEVFDLLPPSDDYKRFWTNATVEVQDYAVSVTFAGAFYAGPWLKTIRPWLRSTLDRMPAALRRRVGEAALKVGMA